MIANQDKLKDKVEIKLEKLKDQKDQLGQKRYAFFVFSNIQQKCKEDIKKNIIKIKKCNFLKKLENH